MSMARLAILRLVLAGFLAAAGLSLWPSAGSRAAGAATQEDDENLVVMVPARRIAPGEEITRADLVEEEVPARLLRASTVTETEDLVGMHARRMLLPGRPIARAAIQQPVLVEKNSEVRVVLHDRTLTLTMKAKALEDGAMNAVIRVVNPGSGKIFYVTVVGAGKAEVTE